MNDGKATYYVVQHLDAKNKWYDSAVGVILEQSTREATQADWNIIGDYTRLDNLWSRMLIRTGTSNLNKAKKVVHLLKKYNPKRHFRVVSRTTQQSTKEIYRI